jgi:membrane fusion protein, multidrug efflux system
VIMRWIDRLTAKKRKRTNPGRTGAAALAAPTTDWIRLQRRFPVRLVLVDPPPGLTLYMGSDARSPIFP